MRASDDTSDPVVLDDTASVKQGSYYNVGHVFFEVTDVEKASRHGACCDPTRRSIRDYNSRHDYEPGENTGILVNANAEKMV